MLFGVPIRPIVIHDFTLNVLQCLVRGLRQAVGLRILRRTLFVNNRINVMRTYTLPYTDLNPQPLGRPVTPLTIRITHVIYNYNNYITSYHKIFRVF